MVSDDKFRRGTETPRRSRRAYYTRRRRHRLGATSSGSGFKTVSPQFMRRVKNRSSRRRRGYVHAMIRPIVVAGALVALFYGAQYGYQEALKSPALSIQSVRLHQVPTMLIEPVRARLKPAYGQNLLALDLLSLRRSIEELPAVRSASVRRVLPDGIVVSVEARQPAAGIAGEQATYIVDREAVVLDTYDQRRTRLPEIRVVDGGGLLSAPGQRLTEDATYGRSLESALAVLEWLSSSDGELPRPVQHIRLDRSGVVMVTARMEIIVGDESNMESKMSAVRSLLYANPPAEPSVIDARYADMLVVRALPGDLE
jgi:cell division septal protein FtsQ